MTSGQQQAVDKLMPHYALEPQSPLDFSQVFGNDNSVWLDIGFGNGESMIHAAQNHPEVNLLGIEVHLPGGHYSRIYTRRFTGGRAYLFPRSLA